MYNYKVSIEINPETIPETSVSAARSDIADVSQLTANFHTKKGKRGFFFSGGNKAENQGSWLDGSFTFFEDSEKYPGWVGTGAFATRWYFSYSSDNNYYTGSYRTYSA